jgi:hypothetical protein
MISSQAQHNLEYGSIPLLVERKIGKGKFTADLASGIAVNFLIRAKVKIEVTDALNRESVSITRLDGMKKGYLSLNSMMNLHYAVAKNWTLNLTPTFRYAISPITTNNIVQTFPYSGGIGAGITYSF